MPLIKMKAGGYMIPVRLTADKGRLYLAFPYNKKLLDEVKQFQGRRWHPETKSWSIPDCARNRFQIAYLAGQNPYERYDRELNKAKPNRDNLMPHQEMMFWHQITRIQAMISGEMGVGKTLSMIEALEFSGYRQIIWVGTGSSIAAVRLEFRKWKSPLRDDVLFLTYHTFRNLVKANDLYVPEALVFDEAQRLKSHNTIQSQMADKMTEAMRSRLKDEAFIGLMSGSPAPNNPTDWWHLCEVACPGFLREGDIWKMEQRMAIRSEQQSASNQKFFKIETWLDDENKCAICGKLPDQHHDNALTERGHNYQKSINEVERLYQRMDGLNIVYFKKDVLQWLPELQFKVIRLEPTDLMKKAEQMILKTTPRTITALLKLRELSDGFQYKDVETGEYETCPLCKGTGSYFEYYDPEFPNEWPSQESMESGKCKKRECTCTHCDGAKEIPKIERVASTIACPKETLMGQLLDEHEPIGRFVTYAGFQASVDRCVNVALKRGWDVIRADGRGWSFLSGNVSDGMDPRTRGLTREQMLDRFQNENFAHNICFVGQGGAAGTGITLTASPTCFIYSNTFNADDRIQLINRIHRPGMDLNRGATIIDCIHLDTDQYVLDNLNKKLDLLAMSMGKFRKAVQEYKGGRDDDYAYFTE